MAKFTIDTNIKLGHKYVDRVYGFKGTATGVYAYMNGCVRVQLDGANKDGLPEGFVFDEVQLDADVEPALPKPRVLRSGGPRGTTPPTR